MIKTEYGPRTRSSSYTKTTPAITRTYINGSLSSTNTSADVPYEIVSNAMSDVVTEDFAKKVKSGAIINNPCSIQDKTVYYRNLAWGYYSNNGVYRYELEGNPGYLSSIQDLSGPDITNAINLAVTRAKAKVTSETMLLGATLGELGETRSMFVSAAARLRHAGTLAHRYMDIISDPRKTHWDRAGRLLGTARNAWMEFRFGWRPFAGEAQAFYRSLQKLAKYEDRQTFRAGENVVQDLADVTSKYLYPSLQWEFTRTLYVTYQIRAGNLCTQRYGGVPDTWGVTKIPQTIWELTRLSWAVDYFLNIGDLIAAYTPDSLWSPRASWVTTRGKVVSVVTQTRPLGGVWSQNCAGPSRETITRTYVRTPDPIPFIAYKSIVGDVAKLLDIASLTRIDATKWLKRVKTLGAKLKRSI